MNLHKKFCEFQPRAFAPEKALREYDDEITLESRFGLHEMGFPKIHQSVKTKIDLSNRLYRRRNV